MSTATGDSNPLRIGARSNIYPASGVEKQFVGYIKDVRLYSAAIACSSRERAAFHVLASGYRELLESWGRCTWWIPQSELLI